MEKFVFDPDEDYTSSAAHHRSNRTMAPRPDNGECAQTLDFSEVPSRVGSAYASKSAVGFAKPTAHPKDSYDAPPRSMLYKKGPGVVSHDSLPLSGDVSLSYGHGVNLVTGLSAHGPGEEGEPRSTVQDLQRVRAELERDRQRYARTNSEKENF